jgi:hypothetical protein
MESDAFHLTRKADPAGEIVLAAEGYLDDAGGAQLKREADASISKPWLSSIAPAPAGSWLRSTTSSAEERG